MSKQWLRMRNFSVQSSCLLCASALYCPGRLVSGETKTVVCQDIMHDGMHASYSVLVLPPHLFLSPVFKRHPCPKPYPHPTSAILSQSQSQSHETCCLMCSEASSALRQLDRWRCSTLALSQCEHSHAPCIAFLLPVNSYLPIPISQAPSCLLLEDTAESRAVPKVMQSTALAQKVGDSPPATVRMGL